MKSPLLSENQFQDTYFIISTRKSFQIVGERYYDNAAFITKHVIADTITWYRQICLVSTVLKVSSSFWIEKKPSLNAVPE